MRRFVGTVFDFVARFKIEHHVRRTGTLIYRNKLVSEPYEERLFDENQNRPDICDRFKEARLACLEYVQSGQDFRSLVRMCQYLAVAEVFYRSGFLEWEFSPSPTVTEDVLRIADAFDPAKFVGTAKVCILNPRFPRSREVGGADADLVLDGTIYELKTVRDARNTAQHILQLVSYCALHRLGGFDVEGLLEDRPVNAVALHYARHGFTAKFFLSEIFPLNGFENYVEAFGREMDLSRRQRGDD